LLTQKRRQVGALQRRCSLFWSHPIANCYKFYRASASVLDIARALDIAHASSLARDITRELDSKLARSYGFFSGLSYYSEVCLFRANVISILLEDFLVIDKTKARQAFRKTITEFFKGVYTTYPETEKLRLRSGWMQFSRKRVKNTLVEEQKQWVFEAYWSFQTVIAREDGKLPAWEGIQIVREQVQPE
jgi:hypothetical protein